MQLDAADKHRLAHRAFLQSAYANPPDYDVFCFRAFGDSSLDFELRVWTPRFENWHRVQSDLAVDIHTRLAGAHIPIPIPQRDLHLIPS